LLNSPEGVVLEKGTPVPLDLDMLYNENIEIVIRNKLHDPNGRHNSTRLARSILQWYYLKQKSGH